MTRYRFLFSFLAMTAIGVTQPLHAGTYTDSAHGGTTGVKRTVLPDYSQGNCAHCHEQHAGIDGAEPTPQSGSASPFALFAANFDTTATVKPYAQSDNFCFYCHTTSSSLQSGGIDNKDYTATFGGYTTSSPAGIFEAFNQASYHNLNDIVVFAEPKFSYFKATSNPCTACHNPHLARRNKANVTDPAYTAISRPTDHFDLWGNDASERMDVSSVNKYQSPYYYNSAVTYEPGATGTSDGSLTPDYNTFCTDCHDAVNTIYSTTLGRNLKKIDWNNEKHGKGNADGDIRVRTPYTVGSGSLGYVLSCLDCHEPHGSPNRYLLRRKINRIPLTGTITDGYNLSYLCDQCHDKGGATWESIHHSTMSVGNDYPYAKFQCATCHGGYPQQCERCHFHGAITGTSGIQQPTNGVTNRRTF
ncbi:MAG: hypothetical protein BM485_11410 [Desulfobulbaceae bacterium DB1]|nr:MAG: hypothetical protein BM485_11410 [Desulfobulbaceae bacterium DB1]